MDNVEGLSDYERSDCLGTLASIMNATGRRSEAAEMQSRADKLFQFWTLYPVYVRGEAHLALHQGLQAAAEYQKILDHRGIVLNFPLRALSHLQLGRAYAMQGDTAKARAAYQDFLTLWMPTPTSLY